MTIHTLLFPDGPLVERITVTLAHTLWHALVVAALLRLSLVGSRSARGRYALACAALLLVVAAAVATFAYVGVAEPAPSSNPLPANVVRSSDANTGDTVAAPPRNPPFRWQQAVTWIVPIWVIGVAVQAAVQLLGWSRVRQLGQEPALTDARWTAALAVAADRLGVDRAVRLLGSARVDVPVVLGAIRPAIVVPLALLTALPVEHIQALLAHELAHVRRHDYLVNLIQCGVEAMFFYHPAVWWISAQIRLEREHCCDDAAALVVRSAPGVAAALVAVEGRRGPRLAMAASGSSLPARVRRLTTPPAARSAPPVVAIAIVALVIVSGWTWLGQMTPTTRAERPPASQPTSVATASQPAEADSVAADDYDRRHNGEVYVGGSVGRPGVYAINAKRPTTVSRIVIAAGDVNVEAGAKGWVTVIRQADGKATSPVDGVPFAALLNGSAPDPELQVGDIIRVSPMDPHAAANIEKLWQEKYVPRLVKDGAGKAVNERELRAEWQRELLGR